MLYGNTLILQRSILCNECESVAAALFWCKRILQETRGYGRSLRATRLPHRRRKFRTSMSSIASWYVHAIAKVVKWKTSWNSPGTQSQCCGHPAHDSCRDRTRQSLRTRTEQRYRHQSEETRSGSLMALDGWPATAATRTVSIV